MTNGGENVSMTIRRSSARLLIALLGFGFLSSGAHATSGHSVGMYASCHLSDAGFMATSGGLAVVSGNEVDCKSTDEENHMAFAPDSPVMRQEPNGFFSIRFACQDAAAAVDFHARHQFKEVFLGLGRDMLGPMLLAPLSSEKDCGALFGFSKEEALGFCGSVQTASAGRIACQEIPNEGSAP